MKDFCVELKVCEGCGALYLRAAERPFQAAVVGTTCCGCAAWLAEFPAPRVRRRRGFECRPRRTAVCVGGAR